MVRCLSNTVEFRQRRYFHVFFFFRNYPRNMIASITDLQSIVWVTSHIGGLIGETLCSENMSQLLHCCAFAFRAALPGRRSRHRLEEHGQLASWDGFCQQHPSPYRRLLDLRSRHRLKKHGQHLRMDSADSILLLQKTAGLQQLSAKHVSHNSAVPVVRVASVFYNVLLKLSLEIIPPDLIIPPPFPLFIYSFNFCKLQRKQGFQ